MTDKPKSMRTDTRIVIWVVASTLSMVALRILALPFLLTAEKLRVIEAQNNPIVMTLLTFAFMAMLIVSSRKTLENIFGKGLIK